MHAAMADNKRFIRQALARRDASLGAFSCLSQLPRQTFRAQVSYLGTSNDFNSQLRIMLEEGPRRHPNKLA